MNTGGAGPGAAAANNSSNLYTFASEPKTVANRRKGKYRDPYEQTALSHDHALHVSKKYDVYYVFACEGTDEMR